MVRARALRLQRNAGSRLKADASTARAVGNSRADVQRWFASLHATPGAANRSAPILSVILRKAEVYGYRPEGTNPCVGIRRYRRKSRERFLSAAELRRLALTLEQHEARRPLHVAFLRLLLLTGCRKSEIATLEWSSYREGHLFLPDAKAGPRTVWLSSRARSPSLSTFRGSFPGGTRAPIFVNLPTPGRSSGREPDWTTFGFMT